MAVVVPSSWVEAAEDSVVEAALVEALAEAWEAVEVPDLASDK